MNYRDFLQKVIYVVINPIIKGMIAIGITPNIVTTIGLLGNIGAAALTLLAAKEFECGETAEAFSHLTWGGIVIIAAGLFDMMDGRLARLGGMSSTFGALWDSVLDRYSELITLFPVSIVFISCGWWTMGVVTFLALVGSIMVSYVRARAEGLDIECKVGLMQRPERVVVTALTTIVSGLCGDLWWLAGGMICIAVLANLTAFWRILHCYNTLKGK